MKRIIALLLAVMLCAALVACGGGSDNNGSNVTTKLEEFLNSADGKEFCNNFKTSAEAGGNCTADCYVEGDTLVFSATFTQDIPESSMDTVKQALVEAVKDESFKSLFDNIKPAINAAVGTDVKLKLVFMAKDGTVLYESYM